MLENDKESDKKCNFASSRSQSVEVSITQGNNFQWNSKRPLLFQTKNDKKTIKQEYQRIVEDWEFRECNAGEMKESDKHPKKSNGYCLTYFWYQGFQKSKENKWQFSCFVTSQTWDSHMYETKYNASGWLQCKSDQC